MSKLTSIVLEGYKSFGAKTEIPIAPLTVFTGLNNSGKTIAINSLLTLKQSYENMNLRNSLLLNGKLVSNGEYSGTLHFYSDLGKGKCITFENTFSIDRTVSTTDFSSEDEIHSFDLLSEIFEDVANIVKINVLNKVTIKSDEDLYNKIENQYIKLTAYYENGKEHNTTIEISNRDEDGYIVLLTNFFYNTGTVKPINVDLMCSSCYFNNAFLSDAYIEIVKPDWVEKNVVMYRLHNIFKAITLLYNGIKYLSPYRVVNNKIEYYEDIGIDVGINGEYTFEIIKYFGDKKSKLFFVPPNSNYDSTPSLSYAINEWLDNLGMNEYDTSVCIRNGDFDDFNVNNVGNGVKQVLPILVKGLLLNENETLILEQPETFLHPKAQLALADFLIEMIKRGKRVIVETHSDHIINRLVRRVSEDDAERFITDKVKILFFENKKYEDGKYTTVVEYKINPIKGFVGVSEDFFSQYSKEISDIFDIALENIKRNGKENKEN